MVLPDMVEKRKTPLVGAEVPLGLLEGEPSLSPWGEDARFVFKLASWLPAAEMWTTPPSLVRRTPSSL